MMDGETIVVRVKRDLDDARQLAVRDLTDVDIDVQTFTCSGEAVPTYTAEEIVGDEAGDSDD